MAEVIAEWSSITEQVTNATLFAPDDWTSAEGRISRANIESLLAKAGAFCVKHESVVRFAFPLSVQAEIDVIKAKWATIDANALALLSTAAAAQQPRRPTTSAATSASGISSVRAGKQKGGDTEEHSDSNSSRRRAPSQQVAQIPPADVSIPQKRGRKVKPSHPALQRQHSQGSSTAVTSLVNEDVIMEEASDRQQRPPPPSQIRISHSSELPTPDPLDRLSVGPEPSRSTSAPTPSTMFNAPTSQKDRKERLETVRAQLTKQVAITDRALRNFSAENKKQAVLAAELAYLDNRISKAEGRQT